MVAVLQFRRVFLASSLVGAGWCLPHSALAFGCVPLVGLLLRLFTASYSCFPSGGVPLLLLYMCSLNLLVVFSIACSFFIPGDRPRLGLLFLSRPTYHVC